jgi:NAD-dependent DNA ligase
MASLDKIRDDAGALRRWCGRFAGRCVVSDKLDGISALLVVGADGQAALFSRGDGQTGQDISWLLAHARGVPSHAAAGVVVRGELLFSKEAWAALPAGKGANPRNAAAGIIHSTRNLDEGAARLLEFVAYELVRGPHAPSAGLEELVRAGFRVVDHAPASELTVESLRQRLVERRAQSPFDIDGLVITHDEWHPRRPGNPKHAFAFKSAITHEQAEVQVTGVEWNVSKDGLLKPTVTFEAVMLGGARLARATGFNAAYIFENGIGRGAVITVIRSGDVIPHITCVVRRAEQAEPQPSGSQWSGKDLVIGEPGGEQLSFRRLEHFAATLKMRGLAAGVLRRLWDAPQPVRGVSDLMHATREQLLAAEGVQAKTADALLGEIARVRAGAPLPDLMVASNAFGRGFGLKKLSVLARALGAEGAPPDAEVLASVGDKTAQAFVNGLPAFWAFLREAGLAPAPAEQKQRATSSRVDGLVVVFTGVRDASLEARIEAAGGRVAAAVSKNTGVVVAKEAGAASSKATKAQQLGVRVCGLQEFVTEFFP